MDQFHESQISACCDEDCCGGLGGGIGCCGDDDCCGGGVGSGGG